VLVCMDDYSQGFRAGYFDRKPAPAKNPSTGTKV
jgi:hypothetical protein